MTESTLQSKVLKAFGSRHDVRLFRNQQGFGWVGNVLRRDNNGTVTLSNARPVTFGLHPGSSDLIGWRQIVVTQDMIGKTVAVFLGVEVKTPTGTIRANQVVWRDVVNASGGIALITRTDEIPWA